MSGPDFYDFIDYQEDALRTESPITIAVSKRMSVAHSTLMQQLGMVKAIGESIDGIKKYVFYGRDVGSEYEDALKELPLDHSPRSEQYIRIIHSIIGVISESAELAGAILKAQMVGNFDKTNLEEEAGDVLWYLSILCDALRTNMQAVAEKNVAKLKKRFSQKFTEHSANNRNLESEREILEQQIPRPMSHETLEQKRVPYSEALAKAVMRQECLFPFNLYCGCVSCVRRFGPVNQELIGTTRAIESARESPRQG